MTGLSVFFLAPCQYADNGILFALDHSLIKNIQLKSLSSPINEGVRGKSFPPTGCGVEPRKKKTL